jgi:aspartyl-tRNA(Asn)/glutamyl-tRNA(Gln) amidotransferase subunit A
MSSDDLCWLHATDLRRLYASKAISPVEVVDAFLRRIDQANSATNAFVTVVADQAREAAKAAEAEMMRNESLPPLHGIPFSVKDNILTKGVRTTMGSPIFRNYVPEEDAGVVAALKRNGSIMLGKTNTPAFGWKGTTDNLVFGPTRNPLDLKLTPGGSSGGAAVAAATGMSAINVGTDGGGSLRIPAAFTGTVGFKPSHGRIPDVPPHTHWLVQHYGPIARSVGDVALILGAVAGPDSRDPYSLPASRDSFENLGTSNNRKLRLLFTTQLGFVDAIDQEVEAICRSAAYSFQDLGWEVVERELDWPNPASFADVISGFGLWSRLRDYEHRTDEIEEGMLTIINSVRSLPNTAFYDACLERNRWCGGALELFKSVDLLLTPAAATLPFAIGKSYPEQINGRAASPSSWSPYLRSFNLTGQPAISIPAGKSKDGLPVGLQIVGPRFGDRQVLEAAAAFERIRPWPTTLRPMP